MYPPTHQASAHQSASSTHSQLWQPNVSAGIAICLVVENCCSIWESKPVKTVKILLGLLSLSPCHPVTLLSPVLSSNVNSLCISGSSDYSLHPWCSSALSPGTYHMASWSSPQRLSSNKAGVGHAGRGFGKAAGASHKQPPPGKLELVLWTGGNWWY